MTDTTALPEEGPSGEGSSFWGPMCFCLQYWARRFANYSYLAGPTSSEGTEAQQLGVLVHRGLKEHMLGEKITVTDRALDLVNASVPALADFEPLAVETVFSTHLGVLDMPEHPQHGRDIRYAPRVDLAVRDKKARRGSPSIWMVDHKTCAKLDQSLIEDYSMDIQAHGLAVLGEEAYGRDFAGVIFHFIKTTGTTGSELVRLPAAPAAVRRFKGRLWWLRNVVAALEVESAAGHLPWDAWPGNFNMRAGCRGRYGDRGKCDDWEKCRWGA